MAVAISNFWFSGKELKIDRSPVFVVLKSRHFYISLSPYLILCFPAQLFWCTPINQLLVLIQFKYFTEVSEIIINGQSYFRFVFLWHFNQRWRTRMFRHFTGYLNSMSVHTNSVILPGRNIFLSCKDIFCKQSKPGFRLTVTLATPGVVEIRCEIRQTIKICPVNDVILFVLLLFNFADDPVLTCVFIIYWC